MIDIRLSDNLDLMREMKDNTVDLIYCDILYGTGRKFKDYQDLKPKREVIEGHYIPRIKEMHRILKDNGSIYLQMDTKINHWIRCILDDIFGYDNFLNEIVWWYKTGGSSKTKFSEKHDLIMLYTKTKKYKFNVLKQKNYTKSKSRKKGIVNYGAGMTEFFEDEKGVFNYTNMHDVFNISYLNSQAKERVGYDTQKPKTLIERIIKASSNEGDLVADFYGGSFTTAEVCKNLNRNFIGCDISEKAVSIGLERIK